MDEILSVDVRSGREDGDDVRSGLDRGDHDPDIRAAEIELDGTIDIRDADTQLREKAALKARVARLEAAQQQAIWRLDSPAQQASAGGLGLVLLGAGIASLLLARRRRSAP